MKKKKNRQGPIFWRYTKNKLTNLIKIIIINKGVLKMKQKSRRENGGD